MFKQKLLEKKNEHKNSDDICRKTNKYMNKSHFLAYMLIRTQRNLDIVTLIKYSVCEINL